MTLDVPEHIQQMFAVAREASLGAPANGQHMQRLRAKGKPVTPVAAMAVPESKVLVLHPEKPERRTQLFAAIDRGDGTRIKELVAAKVLKSGTEMQPAISLIPKNENDLYHFPEPLLQRAVRSGKQESVAALMDIASRYSADDRDAFVNATRPDDKATVLHDLAASIPQGKKIDWKPKAFSKTLNAAQTIDQLVELGADVMARNCDGKTAADLADNAEIKKYLDDKMAKIIAEETRFTQRWQERHAPLAAGHAKRIAEGQQTPAASMQL